MTKITKKNYKKIIKDASLGRPLAALAPLQKIFEFSRPKMDYLLVPPRCILRVTTWLFSDPFSDKVWLCLTPDLRLFSCSAAAR